LNNLESLLIFDVLEFTFTWLLEDSWDRKTESYSVRDIGSGNFLFLRKKAIELFKEKHAKELKDMYDIRIQPVFTEEIIDMEIRK